MTIKAQDMFRTPDNWKEIEAWISRHPASERIHLLTAAMMAWNLAAKTVEQNEQA